MQFEGAAATGTAELSKEELAHRYLWGPNTDQLLADEAIESLTDASQNETLWALTDHLGTVRDLVDDSCQVRKHTSYDSFGKVTGEQYYDSNGVAIDASHVAAVDQLFGYTGKALDETTDLQNNWNRWYDAKVGRWVSQDPIRFEAGDANLYRYVENGSTFYLDSNGYKKKSPWDGPYSMSHPHYHVNGAAALTRRILLEYAYVGKGLGNWFANNDARYVKFTSNAFDECGNFQTRVVNIEVGFIKLEIRKRIKEQIKNGKNKGTLNFEIEEKNIVEGEFTIAGVDATWLEKAIAGTSNLLASHEVSASWGPDGTKYTIKSNYTWHDEIDWNKGKTLWDRQETGWGKLWAVFEGGADIVCDGMLDMEYYITIYYSKVIQGQMKIGNQGTSDKAKADIDLLYEDDFDFPEFDENGDLILPAPEVWYNNGQGWWKK